MSPGRSGGRENADAFASWAVGAPGCLSYEASGRMPAGRFGCLSYEACRGRISKQRRCCCNRTACSTPSVCRRCSCETHAWYELRMDPRAHARPKSFACQRPSLSDLSQIVPVSGVAFPRVRSSCDAPHDTTPSHRNTRAGTPFIYTFQGYPASKYC